MTLAEAKKLCRAVGHSLQKTGYGDEYRYNYQNGSEATAGYTDDIEDAVGSSICTYLKDVGQDHIIHGLDLEGLIAWAKVNLLQPYLDWLRQPNGSLYMAPQGFNKAMATVHKFPPLPKVN
jgi:hypothetical protein